MLRQIIMDHYENPRNHELVNDPQYKSVNMDSETCIDNIDIQAHIEDGIIKDIRFDGEACAICTSSTSIMTELLIGRTIEEAKIIIENYMNMIYLANQKAKDKLKIIAVDIKVGLNIMISAAHLEPVFTGQAKEILSNSDMLGFCKETIMKGLDNWAKANPQDLARLSRFFKDIAEVRQKSEASKAKIVTKYQSNVITGLPAKYIRPLGKEDIELIIVEGESAKGTVETGRDKYKQGVFPIRGKIINAFKNSRQTFFNNEEVQGITRIILGSDYKRGFDVKDCKVSKVIFMADADVDRVDCPEMPFV